MIELVKYIIRMIVKLKYIIRMIDKSKPINYMILILKSIILPTAVQEHITPTVQRIQVM